MNQCFAVLSRTINRKLPKSGFSKPFLAIPWGKLNWTGPVANSSPIRTCLHEKPQKIKTNIYKFATPSLVRGLLGTAPPDPTLESASPSPRQGSIWHRFNIDSTLIRHRFPDSTLNRCRINVESMLNRCQIDP